MYAKESRLTITIILEHNLKRLPLLLFYYINNQSLHSTKRSANNAASCLHFGIFAPVLTGITTLMELFTLFALAIGLCFDTFAVSVSSGLMKREITFKQALRIAIVLGAFQGIMPAIGWFLGISIKEYIEQWDHWIAFILLGALGAKMILESIGSKENKNFDPLNMRVIVGMGIATSIDALIVGVSFGMFEVNLPLAVAVIGGVTFLASMLGILFGKKTGEHFGEKIEMLGGIILIIIGSKILVEHLLTR